MNNYKICPKCGVNVIAEKEDKCEDCRKDEKFVRANFAKNGPITVSKIKVVKNDDGTKKTVVEPKHIIQPKHKAKYNKKSKLTAVQHGLSHPFQGGGCSGK